jgi:hypothetical protein
MSQTLPPEYADWLRDLGRSARVLIRNGAIHFGAEITNATTCYLFVRKLKFARSSGWMIKPKGRLRLRLVRTEQELL